FVKSVVLNITRNSPAGGPGPKNVTLSRIAGPGTTGVDRNNGTWGVSLEAGEALLCGDLNDTRVACNLTLRFLANDTLGDFDPANHVAVLGPIFLEVNDTAAPVVSGLRAAGAVSGNRTVEIHEAVNITVNATDVGKVARVEARIHAPNGTQIQTKDLVKIENDTYGGTVNFTTAGSFTIRVQAFDGLGNPSENSSTQIDVLLNLPPRLVNEIPAAGTFARGRPVVSVDIVDRNLDRSTVELRLAGGGVNVTATIPEVGSTNTTGRLVVTAIANGIRITYNHTGGSAFPNRAEVTATLAATDTVGEASSLSWSFRVDEDAPTLTFAVREPRFPPSGATVFNVSGNPLLVLSASDGSGALAGSGVGKITYRILRDDGARVDDVDSDGDSTSFTLSSLTNFAREPDGLYTITATAVDRVGLSSDTRTFQVYRDAEAPSILHTPRGVDSQGRIPVAVTATDRVGVGGVSIRYFLDDANRALVQALSRQGDSDLWTTNVTPPEGASRIRYFLLANDTLGNQVSAGPDAADPSRPYAFSLQNQAPTVHFTSPPALS
ncbi:MAG: hypothetical protein ACT4PT_08705, partial [Methanobacteriota archaeon]